MFKDPFAILGVPYDASRKELASAYRRLAFAHHPDVSNSKGSIALMQEINWAYEVLSHPEKRRSYYTKQHSNGNNGYRSNGNRYGANGRKTKAEERVAAEGSAFHSPSMEILGGTADRAIIGAGIGLTVLGISLIFGINFTSVGALVALLLGVWIGSGTNTRMSSQNGIGIGGVIGLFYGAIIGVSIFGSVENSNLISGLLICAPSMILLGASMGAMLGGLAAGLRKLQA
ncbi:MAG: J domain-containing protein [Anaerolineales bacterium]